jgi:Xaa-Pro aminopeptidase
VTDRIRKLISGFDKLKIDALLVTDDVNIRYLTRFPAHESWLLVCGRAAYFVTDFRYIVEARQGLKGTGVSVAQFEDSIVSSTLGLARKNKVRTLGVDERQLTVAQYRRIRSLVPSGMKMKAADGAVDSLRMIKEPEEVQAIREALKVNLEAYRVLEKAICPGRTERDLLAELEAFARRKKVGFSFPPIIASGPNSAMPHARVSARQLRSHEPLLIDCGIDRNGYKSDLTRMFFLGKMTPSYQKVLFSVGEAQQAAIKKIKPGVSAAEIDATARNCLKEHGLDRYFGHSLGHGVGLDIHEMPRISQKSGAILAENMVFTVEPGVYFPGRYGIRLEEMVLVTKTGCEVLSAAAR